MAPRALLGLLILCLAATPALAQTAPKKEPAKKEQKAAPAAPAGDPIVARVDGTVIHRSDLDAMRSGLSPQAQQLPPEQLYPRLLDQAIALDLAAAAARKTKIPEDPRVKQVLALNENEILANAYFADIAKKEVSEAKLRAKYDEYIKQAAPHEEVHARHILVPTEDEAKQIIEQLKKGADFAKLASEKTTDPAGKTSGGDLGYFGEKDMVPEFAKAAFALKPGEFTQTPIKTQFGWHVIKVEDRRQSKPPTYEEVAPQIARQMAQEIADARIKELAATAKIEVFNADGTPAKLGPAQTPQASAAPAKGATPTATAAPAPAGDGGGQPALLPLQNGTPGAPPPASSGPPMLAPATQNLGK
ncbi:MAG TPA: peptidylprolyl isomerase [Stellaceae bacterium]|nr:peptidylprolyl isomerase [Stellaceae bacterium]